MSADKPVLDIFTSVFGINGSEVANVNKSMMDNPLRPLAQLGLEQSETLLSALLASKGKPEDLGYALFVGALERIEDPLILIRMFANMSLTKSGIDPIKRFNL